MDKWCSDIPLIYRFSNLFAIADNKCVVDADCWHNGQWRPSFVVPHIQLRVVDLQDLRRVLDDFGPIASQGHESSWQRDPFRNQPHFRDKQMRKKKGEEDYISPQPL